MGWEAIALAPDPFRFDRLTLQVIGCTVLLSVDRILLFVCAIVLLDEMGMDEMGMDEMGSVSYSGFHLSEVQVIF